jgi:hypothetical protein
MKVIALGIFANFENHRIQLVSHPADRAILLVNIHLLMQIIRPRKNLLRFLETNASIWIRPKRPTLSPVKMESRRLV